MITPTPPLEAISPAETHNTPTKNVETLTDIDEIRMLLFTADIPTLLKNMSSPINNTIRLNNTLIDTTTLSITDLAYYLYIESDTHHQEISDFIISMNPCVCFMDRCVKSRYYSHRILLVDLLLHSVIINGYSIDSATNQAGPRVDKTNKTCKKEACKIKNCPLLTNLTLKTITNYYRTLISANINNENNKTNNLNSSKVIKHALRSLRIPLEKNFIPFNTLESMYIDSIVYHYKVFIYLNMHISKGEVFGSRMLFDQFINNNQKSTKNTVNKFVDWRVLFIVSESIGEILCWDFERGHWVLNYLTSLVINSSGIKNSTVCFEEEMAHKFIKGLRYNNLRNSENSGEINKAIIAVMKQLFGLFDEPFQEECIETIQYLKIDHILLEELFVVLEKCSLFIKFSFILLFNYNDSSIDNSRMSKYIEKYVSELPSVSTFSKSIGTPDNTSINTTNISINSSINNLLGNNTGFSLKSRVSNARGWKSRKKLIRCFERLIIRDISLYEKYLYKNYISLLDDPIADIRESVSRSFYTILLNIKCTWKSRFISQSVDMIKSIGRREANHIVVFVGYLGRTLLGKSINCLNMNEINISEKDVASIISSIDICDEKNKVLWEGIGRDLEFL